MSLCSVVSVDPLLLFLFRGSHKSPCGMRVTLYRRANPSCAREAEEVAPWLYAPTSGGSFMNHHPPRKETAKIIHRLKCT